MQHYKAFMVAALLFLVIGAASPVTGEKELIIKLQGDVIVLQRQIRDLQESFDKWQGQSASALQKISEGTNSAARDIASISDTLKTSQSTQNNSLAGASSQLQRIAEQLSRQNKSISGLSDQLNSLRVSIQDYQQKMEPKDKSDNGPPPSNLINNPENLYASAYDQFNKGNYEKAITYFRTYLNTNRQSENSDDALFYTGESLFFLARYEEALREYERLIAEYPNSDRLTHSTFKKGMALLHLERRNEGVNVLKSVIAQSPGSQEASFAKNELSRLGEDYSSTTNQSSPPKNRQRPI